MKKNLRADELMVVFLWRVSFIFQLWNFSHSGDNSVDEISPRERTTLLICYSHVAGTGSLPGRGPYPRQIHPICWWIKLLLQTNFLQVWEDYGYIHPKVYLWGFRYLDYSFDRLVSYSHKSNYSPESNEPQIWSPESKSFLYDFKVWMCNQSGVTRVVYARSRTP